MKIYNLLLISVLCLSSFTITAQNGPDVSVKFGKGMRITAADSSFQMKATFRFQSLFTAERSLDEDGEFKNTFLIRRSRIKLGGWMMNPNLAYKVELALSNRDLGSSKDWGVTSQAPKIILDAVVKWKFHKNLSVWAGTTKLPGNRERVVSSQKLQLVDRSLVNSIFNIDREMCLQLRGAFDIGNTILRPSLAWSFGEARNVTAANINGFNYTARVEWLPLGKFASKGDYFEADLKREKKPKLSIGVVYNFNDGDTKDKKTGSFLTDAEGNYLDNDLQTIMADLMFKYNGLSILAEYANKTILLDDNEVREDIVSGSGKSYLTGNGINVQAGYLFKGNIETVIRYTIVSPDTDVSFAREREYTIGVSKYIVGHSLKLQGDVSMTDEAGVDDNSLRFRLQMEVQF